MKKQVCIQVFFAVHGARHSKKMVWQGDNHCIQQFIVEWAARNGYQLLTYMYL